MIERYTRPEMGSVWTQQRRMETWLEVELAATEAWAEEGVVPKEAAKAARERPAAHARRAAASLRGARGGGTS